MIKQGRKIDSLGNCRKFVHLTKFKNPFFFMSSKTHRAIIEDFDNNGTFNYSQRNSLSAIVFVLWAFNSPYPYLYMNMHNVFLCQVRLHAHVLQKFFILFFVHDRFRKVLPMCHVISPDACTSLKTFCCTVSVEILFYQN